MPPTESQSAESGRTDGRGAAATPVPAPRRLGPIAWILTLLCFAGTGLDALRHSTLSELKVDELWHYEQAHLFASGNWRQFMKSDDLRYQIRYAYASRGLEPPPETRIQELIRQELPRDEAGRPSDVALLSMLPGYHLAQTPGLMIYSHPGVARGFNGLIAVLLLVLMYACLRRLHHPGKQHATNGKTGSGAAAADPASQTGLSLPLLAVWALPVLWPFHWLIYTDVLSAVCVIGAVVSTLHRRFALAGLVGLISIGIRQTNVVVVALLPLLAFLHENGSRPWSPRILLEEAKKHLATVLALIAFVVFVAANERVSIGPIDAHPATPNLDNLIFSIAAFWFCTMPIQVHTIVRGMTALRPSIKVSRRFTLWFAAGVGAAAGAAWAFSPDHLWNQLEVFDNLLRNHVIDLMQTQAAGVPIGRIVLGVGLFWAGCTLATTRLLARSAPFVALVWLLSIGPVVLIDPRYYIVPFAFWMLLREKLSWRWELAAWAWCLFMGMAIHLVNLHTEYFI